MKAKMIAAVLMSLILMTGCANLNPFSSTTTTAQTTTSQKIDAVLVKSVSVGITSLTLMNKAAHFVMPILYISGIVDQSVEREYELAAASADRVLPQVQVAYDAYVADPTSDKSQALKVVYIVLCEAWSDYNSLSGKVKFVDNEGNILLPGMKITTGSGKAVPTPSSP